MHAATERHTGHHDTKITNMSKIIQQDITEIKSGVVILAVTCQNQKQTGHFQSFNRKYPKLGQTYRKAFTVFQQDELTGKGLPIRVNSKLTVICLFVQTLTESQTLHTNTKALTAGIARMLPHFPSEEIYIPWEIGCENADGDWNSILPEIKNLDITIVKPN